MLSRTPAASSAVRCAASGAAPVRTVSNAASSVTKCSAGRPNLLWSTRRKRRSAAPSIRRLDCTTSWSWWKAETPWIAEDDRKETSARSERSASSQEMPKKPLNLRLYWPPIAISWTPDTPARALITVRLLLITVSGRRSARCRATPPAVEPSSIITVWPGSTSRAAAAAIRSFSSAASVWR